MTDANLLLGYLDAAAPLAGGVALDAGAAEAAVLGLARALALDPLDVAAGIVRIASLEMARAVRVMTIERGRDPRFMALLPFGGAGPLHAAQIAEELGVTRIVVPRASGVLSALGLVVSERRRDLVESVLLSGDALTRRAVARVVERLADRGRAELCEPEAEVRAAYDLRYAGQAFELTVSGDAAPDPAALRASFDSAHEERYGHSDPDARLELVTVRVAVAVPGGRLPGGVAVAAGRRGTRRALFGGRWRESAVWAGVPAEPIVGPAIVELPEATLVVPPGWSGRADADGSILLERA